MDGGHGSVDGKLFLGTTKKIEGALFMAPPNHPFLKEVMGVQFRVLESQFWPSVHATGPAAFREAYQTSSSEVVLIPEVHMNTGKRLSSFKGVWNEQDTHDYPEFDEKDVLMREEDP
mmetsp:Transcript_6675/g.16342  ORF Transcript_6675/g.16342 Transcript_6675/m.16342 type:complete len:117 (+) Transcript_6675:105-455(+)